MSIITSDQVRAGKALLRWSGQELAKRAGVSLSTIRRIEAASGIPEDQNIKTLIAVAAALEAGGVEFIGRPGDSPGVRFKTG